MLFLNAFLHAERIPSTVLKIADRSFFDTVRGSRRILAFALGGLGDVVHIVPALRTLRLNFPEARIDVLVSSGSAAFLRLVDGIDDVIPYKTRKAGWSFEELRLYWQLFRRRYDLCLNFWGSNHASGIALATGARVRLGRQPYETWKKAWRYCHTHIGIYPHLQEPMYQQWTGLLEGLGLTVDPRFDLQAPAEAYAQSGLDAAMRGRYIHISPNASEAPKELALPVLIEVLQSLQRAVPDHSLVLSGTAAPRQLQRTQAIVAALDRPPLAVFNGSLTTASLYAVIQNAALHLSVDSGPLHMAVAANTPTVSCFQENPFIREYLPSGERHYAFVTAQRQAQGITAIPAPQIVAHCLQQLQRFAPATQAIEAAPATPGSAAATT